MIHHDSHVKASVHAFAGSVQLGSHAADSYAISDSKLPRAEMLLRPLPKHTHKLRDYTVCGVMRHCTHCTAFYKQCLSRSWEVTVAKV